MFPSMFSTPGSPARFREGDRECVRGKGIQFGAGLLAALSTRSGTDRAGSDEPLAADFRSAAAFRHGRG